MGDNFQNQISTNRMSVSGPQSMCFDNCCATFAHSPQNFLNVLLWNCIPFLNEGILKLVQILNMWMSVAKSATQNVPDMLDWSEIR